MLTINDDNSIYVTRGDTVAFSVTAEKDGENYVFKAGDVLRIKVFEKKNCENVVLQKDFPVTRETETVEIFLTEQETKIGEVISKPKDYWYEVELNPLTNPQTIIGYDEEGARLFKLFPEGEDLTEDDPIIQPEDIPVVDKALDLTSERPVENQAIARAVTRLSASIDENKELTEELAEHLGLERARLNNLVSTASDSSDADYELKDIRVGVDGGVYPTAGEAVRGQINVISKDLAELKNICIKQSDNLYNPDLQTVETISPHYYVHGEPYSTTEYDALYNCTAPIEVEQNTEYTIGLVHSNYGYTAPWAKASQGLFFYDAYGNYISGTTNTTFVTPIGTNTIRFNYAIIEAIPLDELNANCMLVKGNTLPTEYTPYRRFTLEERVKYLEGGTSNFDIQYLVDNDTIKVSANYSTEKDILVTLKKKGGNNIFDFYKFQTFAHGRDITDIQNAELNTLQTTNTDWHAPFIVKAVENIDGEILTQNHFTGGNHEYTNTGNGGTPTARTDSVRFFADNIEINGGSGKCKRLEIRWTNYVQAANTKKANGTGREVLIENHELVFDGFEWVSYVELIPLEDVNMLNWYGLQGVGTNTIYQNIKYIGGDNRAIYNGASQSSKCGNAKATKVVCYGSEHKMEIEVDATLDLGNRQYYIGDSGIFAEQYGKVYFNIISNKMLAKECVYSLRGKYKFSAIN